MHRIRDSRTHKTILFSNETFRNGVQCCRFSDKKIATGFHANNNGFGFLI